MAFVGVAKADNVDDYKKACDSGFAWGCSGLGFMYSNGQGVKQDYFAAADLYNSMFKFLKPRRIVQKTSKIIKIKILRSK